MRPEYIAHWYTSGIRTVTPVMYINGTLTLSVTYSPNGVLRRFSWMFCDTQPKIIHFEVKSNLEFERNIWAILLKYPFHW